MDYRNSFVYVQKMIDRILRLFRHFCKIYVDDIVIFSTSLQKYIKYFIIIFQTFFDINIHLTFVKVFLGYFSVQLLG